MQRFRSALGVAAAIALLATGCGKKDEAAKGKATTDDTAPAKAADSKAKPADPPAPAAFDSDAFCAAVFAPADVNGILGVEGLAPVEQRGRIPDGMGQCDVGKADEHGIPVMSAKVMADCRGLSGDVARHREVAKGLADEGTYKDVAIGKGGAYSKTVAAKIVIHQITYVDETMPCSVTVSTAHIDDNKVETLTQHVKSKLTDANRPRKK